MNKEHIDIIGTGWSFPPTFARQGEYLEMVSGLEDIRQSLEILLSTRLKERLYHGDFGCDLHAFLFEEIDQHLISDLKRTVSDAILYHEPRIQVEEVRIDQSRSTEGLLLINILFFARSTNSRYNMVYPFYIQEAA